MIHPGELSDLTEIVIEARREISALRREVANMVKVGVVCDVDATKGYRLEFGTREGEKKKTAWLPHPEQGGDARSWVPLTVGEICTLIGPPGDVRQSVLIRSGFSDTFKQPSSDLKENVFDYGKSRITVREEEIREETVVHNTITEESINERSEKEINQRAEKKVAIMGLEEIKIQAKDTAYTLHTDKDGVMLARKSILIRAPSVTISMSDPGPIDDVVPKEEST